MDERRLTGTQVCEVAPGDSRSSGRRRRSLLVTALVAAIALLGLSANAAFANAPNPTSVKVDSETVHGAEVTVTVSGTWTWLVPNGAQKDCNDSRIGVGYAVDWGDNTAHPLKKQGAEPIIYVGSTTDDWVHSVTVGTQTVDGPFKKGPATLEESMLGETPEGTLFGFGDEQGISTGATSAVPTEEDAKHWVSNCGPTAQSKVDGQTIGNSEPANPQQGFPNGTWGPISHTYATSGEYKICPVMYDPHGNEVGQAAQNSKEITASLNNDNSVESNGNASECTISVIVKPKPEFTVEKLQKLSTEPVANFSTAPREGKAPLKVEYEIVVNNTGKAPVNVEQVSDPLVPECATTKPKQPEVKVGETKVVESTCSHTITTEGTTFTNVATVKGNGEEKETPPVEAKTPNEPKFTVEKLQKLSTEPVGAFSTAPREGKAPLKVEYEIVVNNTGKVPVTVEQVSDPLVPECSTIKPAQPEVKVGETKVVESTCSHTITTEGTSFTNVATVKASKEEKETPPVEAKTPNEPKFTVEKLQKLAGEPIADFNRNPREGKAPLTVEYEIVVNNTGKVPVTVEQVTDPNVPACDTTLPLQPEVKVGETDVVESTCSHTITTEGTTFTNVATVKGNKENKETPPVEAKTPFEPKFTVEKLQRVVGGAYTTATLEGKAPLVVEYAIVVTNTGNATVTVEQITDANVPACDTTTPLQPEVKVHESKVVESTCSHTITTPGATFTNAATVKASKEEKETPPVISKTPTEGFTIKKEQKLAGKGEYTTGKLEAKVGETVDYLITVENTGEAPETFSAPEDVKCNNIQGGPTGPLKHGEKASWTCEHTLTEAGTYENVAAVKGNEEPKKSNPVIVEVPKAIVKAECTISEGAIALHGVSGAKRKTFTVHVPAIGIKQITFYLDGKKLKTLTETQAKNGQFTIKIDPAKLGFGAHKVSFKTVMKDGVCPNVAKAAVFVHPKPPAITPKFTG